LVLPTFNFYNKTQLNSISKNLNMIFLNLNLSTSLARMVAKRRVSIHSDVRFGTLLADILLKHLVTRSTNSSLDTRKATSTRGTMKISIVPGTRTSTRDTKRTTEGPGTKTGKAGVEAEKGIRGVMNQRE
jgi:hypothetical protein